MWPKLLIFISLVYIANSLKEPYITRCKADDAKCLQQSAQTVVPILAAGIPEFGTEKLDPIYFESLDGSSNGLTLNFYNFTGTGLKDCTVLYLKRDVPQSKIKIQLECTVDFHSQYIMEGQVLLLHIEGKGDARIILRKIVITVDSEVGEKVGRDGKKYWTVKRFHYTFELKDKATFEVTGLFSGNQVLERVARELFDNSSNEIIEESGEPIIRAVVKKIVENVKKFYGSVPITDLTLD